MGMTTPLWTLAEICSALRLSAPAEPSSPITGVSIDSRTLNRGDLFIALSGTPSGGFKSSFATDRDGHDYVSDAAARGAAAVVVSRPIEGVPVPQLIVQDTLVDGLWALASAARMRASAKVLAITGSAGKSTTKQFLSAGLAAHAPPGSYNNFWGVPLTLTRLPKDALWAVVEIGMNQPGEIARLSELANPHVAIVVNVAPVHLENLGSLDAIRQEKLSITAGLRPDGVLVLPIELPHDDARWNGRIVRFGIGGDVEAVRVDYELERASIVARVVDRSIQLSITSPGPHRVHNVLAALTAAWAAGANLDEFVAGIRNVGVMEGRGVAHTVGGVTVIDDSFNANPASVGAALATLKTLPAQRRVAILGDMLELGEAAPQYHRELSTQVSGVDKVTCVGSLMSHLYAVLPEEIRFGHYEDSAAIDLQELTRLLHPGDVVLVKGSKRVFWVSGFAQRLVEALRRRELNETE